MFGAASLASLDERVAYEVWFLEAVYKIVDRPLQTEKRDRFEYPPSGGPPRQHMYGSGHLTIGDWRAGFLNAGAPLVFVTEFKLLDMLVEWVLVENGQRPSHKFSQKIATLKGRVRFPPLIETRVWLRDRLVALYEELDPLRGTVIHDRHFKGDNGTVTVSRSRGGTIGPPVTFSEQDLRNLAVVLLSLLRYLAGIWTFDEFREKALRRALDEIAHLHRLPSLGQLPPYSLTVRVYVFATDSVSVDLLKIRQDLSRALPSADVMFDLAIVAVSRDGTRAQGYQVGWEQVRDEGEELRLGPAELARYSVDLPADVDPASLASQMDDQS